MKVFIGIPTAEYARHAIFYDYLALLTKPEGTISAGFHTNSASRNRNLIIDEAIHSKCSHVLFLDDDMAFAPDTLMRLLEHDLDVVSSFYLNRSYPHTPVVFDYDFERKYKTHLMKDNENGLIEVEAVGFGTLLCKIEIFEKLEKPYVREGQIFPDRRSEDVAFCLRLRKEGIKIHCDLDIPVGHIGTSVFWPNNIDGKWHTAVDTNGNELFNIPQMT